MNKLIENHKLKLTTLFGVIVFVVSLIAHDTRWKTNVLRDLKEIRNKQDRLGWHREDMHRWVRTTEQLNKTAGWQAAEVYPDRR